MELWIDSANLEMIQMTERLGILAGVTTNPAILAQANTPLDELLLNILKHQQGPVTVQVVAKDAVQTILQGKKLYSISERIIVKIPMTKSGLEAIHQLSLEGIPTMATVVFYPHQALLAAKAGAHYAAPYINRMAKTGLDPWKSLKEMKSLFNQYGLKTKILGASLSTLEQVMQCAELGVDAVTLKDELFEKLVGDMSETRLVVEQFTHVWKGVNDPLLEI